MSGRGTAATGHPTPAMVERYARGGGGGGATGGHATAAGVPDQAWTVEAHLEACAPCRQVLAEVVERSSPRVSALLRDVGTRLTAEVPRQAQAPVRRRGPIGGLARWSRSWTTPATLPRVLMTVLVVAAAVALDLAHEGLGGRSPSLVLLVAPVAPLMAVSAAWSRGLDPAYEVVAASPRAGLDLVLRRTLAVLAVVVPALAVAGALVGVSPARWLLPCLAFTGGALALGELVGLRRAAWGLAALWAVAVAGPSLWLQRGPVVLDPAARPAWLAVLVATAALLAARRKTYTRPADLR